MQLEDFKEDFAAIQERLSKIEISLAEQKILLQNKIEDVEEIKENQVQLVKKVEPLEKYMVISIALIKAVSVAATLIGLVLGIIQIFSKIK